MESLKHPSGNTLRADNYSFHIEYSKNLPSDEGRKILKVSFALK